MAYAREFIWVVLAQAATFVGGLVTVKTAAVVLGPAEYGKLSVALAIVGIFQVCLYGAISQTATQFFVFASAHDLLSDYKLSLLKLIGMGAVAIVALWILGGTLGVQGCPCSNSRCHLVRLCDRQRSADGQDRRFQRCQKTRICWNRATC